MNRRTALRAAFVAHLIDATAAEERVFSGRLVPVEEPELPAIGYTWLKGQPEYVDATDA